LIAVLAETDFHDNPATAKWIIDCKDTIARAYVNALVNTFGIAKKQVLPVTPPPATSPRLYRVQVGAYSQKANAEAMLAKIKAAGFEGYII
jgi:N-acetylmuramoyl-L-alanine amidase